MADENRSYEQSPTDPFEGIKFPEKFLKDGKPDLSTFVNSYGELETKWNTKTEDLRNTVKSELETELNKGKVAAADKYELPKIEGVDPDEMAKHPSVAAFRADAFEMGMTQPQFERAITRYIELATPKDPDMVAVKAALGDNAEARIAAADTWAKGFAKNPAELAALASIAINADGIKVIERMAGFKIDDSGGPTNDGATLTIEKLREMQNDPRYFDPNKREQSFVDEVTKGYEKLYAKSGS